MLLLFLLLLLLLLLLLSVSRKTCLACSLQLLLLLLQLLPLYICDAIQVPIVRLVARTFCFLFFISLLLLPFRQTECLFNLRWEFQCDVHTVHAN